jgi:hypothetical protein
VGSQALPSKRRTKVRPMFELLGNGGFAQPFASEVLDFLRPSGDFGRPTVRAALFAGLSNARFHPIAQKSRSNSATANMPANARPLGIDKSRASLSETNPTFRALSSCNVAMRSTSDLRQRSSRHTTMTSISLRRAARSNFPTRTGLCAGAHFLDCQRNLPTLAFGVYSRSTGSATPPCAGGPMPASTRARRATPLPVPCSSIASAKSATGFSKTSATVPPASISPSPPSASPVGLVGSR